MCLQKVFFYDGFSQTSKYILSKYFKKIKKLKYFKIKLIYFFENLCLLSLKILRFFLACLSPSAAAFKNHSSDS